MSKAKATDSDRRRMNLRGNRRALVITAKTLDEALRPESRLQYVREKKRKKVASLKQKNRDKKNGKNQGATKPDWDGPQRFEGGMMMCQGGLPTLGKRR